ncbi:hypothetical protein [Staphylococcus hominis]
MWIALSILLSLLCLTSYGVQKQQRDEIEQLKRENRLLNDAIWHKK